MIDRRVVVSLLATCAAALWPARAALAQRAGIRAQGDSAAAAVVVERFHRAIAAGDSAGAAALLTADARVLESGDVETKLEYLRSHLAADIAFARAVGSTRKMLTLGGQGDVAWAASTSRAIGTFEARPVDSDGAELMVLTRTAQGWRIAAIHWSSHRHRP